MALYSLLFSSGFPPPHTAAGINMSFFPMSRILPGTGAYFLRRSFQDDPIYKESLRGFINTLVQRRFHQEFFIEGARSRSGKLLPPRYGILNNIVDGARRADIGEVLFIPTSIAYDQILELSEYVRQNLGDEKEAESSSSWCARSARRARESSGASTCASPSRSRCANSWTAAATTGSWSRSSHFRSRTRSTPSRRSRPRRSPAPFCSARASARSARRSSSLRPPCSWTTRTSAASP
jgi:hypothetical protein